MEINHIAFPGSQNQIILGRDSEIFGKGFLTDGAAGEILLDVVSVSSAGLTGICQAKISFNGVGQFDLVAKLVFSESRLSIDFSVNETAGTAHGLISGESLVVTFQLISGGAVLYEYRMASTNALSQPEPKASLGTIRMYAPTVVGRDAIGNYCLWLRDYFSAAGYSVILYADGFDVFAGLNISKAANLFYDVCPDDLIFVVYSTYDRWLDKISRLPNTKILSFQNVTPPDYYQGHDSSAVQACLAAISQLHLLESFDHFFASTRFTADYLQSHFQNRQEFTIVPPFGGGNIPPMPGSNYRPPKIRFLYVGRVVPNKGIDDILSLFQEVTKLEPNAQLDIVGSLGLASYVDDLESRVATLAQQGMHVSLAGSVSDSMLDEYFHNADVLVCMSKHEGFCVPVYEAMARGVLVCSTHQDAVAEVLGGTGLLFPDERNPAALSKIAEKVVGLVRNRSSYQLAIEAQYARAQELSSAADGEIILEKIKSV